MDFSFTPEQEALKQATIEFAQRELNHDLAVREKGGSFSRDDWRKCADFGILGLNVPREYGGQNHDIVTTLCILEALGYGCRDNGLSYYPASLVRCNDSSKRLLRLPASADNSATPLAATNRYPIASSI